MQTQTTLRTTLTRLAAGPLTLVALCPGPAAAQGANGVTEIVSLDAGGGFLTNYSAAPAISEDARYVAFTSREALDPADANGESDIYRLDRQTGIAAGVSCTPAGIFGNDSSFEARMSADGRWIVFSTLASNFEPLDANGTYDVYRKDMLTGELVRVSNAELSPAAGDDESLHAAISDDGRWVAFQSSASDIVANDTNGASDVFLRDMQTGLAERLSEGVWGQANGSSFWPMIAGDGSRIAFTSAATNLLIFDGNAKNDVFVVEPGSNPMLVSRNTLGQPANGHSTAPHVSADGGLVVFSSSATNLTDQDDLNGFADVYAFDVDTLAMERVSLTSGQLGMPSNAQNAHVSRDGRYVAFSSLEDFAPYASPGYRDVFVRDLVLDTTWTASRPSGTTTIANGGHSNGAVLAQGGAVVAWYSDAPDMVPGDPNGENDVFVRTMHPDPTPYCSGSTTSAGCLPELSASGWPSVSTGDFFTFQGNDLPNQKLGLVFYGFAGRAMIPFGGAALCVAPPLARTPLIATNGNPPAMDDCSGFFAWDMNGFAAGLGGGNPRPELSIVGQQVNVQFWGRDGAASTFLTNAVEYVVGP